MLINLLLKWYMCGILCEGVSYVYFVFVLDLWFLVLDLMVFLFGLKFVGVNCICFLL